MRELATIFLTVFLAEIGDKTQLATVLFATDGGLSRIGVFAAAALALIVSTAIAVVAGAAAESHLQTIPLKLIAGLGFIAIGIWTVLQHFQAG
jgi:putative Ca2+/H+ antiporter (TMEM165/GDT1 family)